MALKSMGIAAAECMAVGDKLSMDIQAARHSHMKSCLVLTGETTLADLNKSKIKPDYVIKDLRKLP